MRAVFFLNGDNMVTTILNLLVLFQLKHLICDYYLQGEYMLGKFNKVGWAKPLAAHASVHSFATFMIALYYVPNYALVFALIDLVVHFCIDKWKVEASRQYDAKLHPQFWQLLGIDQFLHHMTHYMLMAGMMHLMYGHATC